MLRRVLATRNTAAATALCRSFRQAAVVVRLPALAQMAAAHLWGQAALLRQAAATAATAVLAVLTGPTAQRPAAVRVAVLAGHRPAVRVRLAAWF